MNVAYRTPADATGGVARYGDSLRDALAAHDAVTVHEAFADAFPADADLLHVTAPRVAHWPTVWRAARRGLPVVLTAHGLDLYWPPGFRASARSHPRAWLQERLVPRLARHASAVVVPSAFLRRELAHGTDLDRERIHVVPHGVDRVFRSGSARVHGDFLLTTTPTAGLIDAVADARASGVAYEVVVAGERGYGTAAAERAVARHDLGDAVRFVGHVADPLFAMLARSAVAYLHDSAYDTFALPVAEAMASATPVVAVAQPAVCETLAGAGLVVDTAGEMADAIVRLRNGPGLRRERAAAGCERAAPLTWERAADATVAVYREVCGE